MADLNAISYKNYTIDGNYASHRKPVDGEQMAIAELFEASGLAPGKYTVKLSPVHGNPQRGQARMTAFKPVEHQSRINFVMQLGGNDSAFEVSFQKPHTEASVHSVVEKLLAGLEKMRIQAKHKARRTSDPAPAAPPVQEKVVTHPQEEERPPEKDKITLQKDELLRAKDALENRVIQAHDAIQQAELAETTHGGRIASAEEARDQALTELRVAEERLRASESALQAELSEHSKLLQRIEKAKQDASQVEAELAEVEKQIENLSLETAKEKAREVAKDASRAQLEAMIAELKAKLTE